MAEDIYSRTMASHRRTSLPTLRLLSSFAIRFGTLILIASALLVALNQVFAIDWQIILLAVAAATILVLARLWYGGIFISPWSLRLRTLYRKYSHFGALPLLSVVKSRRRRSVELLKGVLLVIIVLIAGIVISLIHLSLSEEIPFDISGSALGTTWQVHAVIIGFSFVALTFVWEEIYDNSLNDELTRLFVEDIGSIWTVTFVFGANLVIGAIAFTHSSAETVEHLPIYTTAVLFTVSILTVAKRFLDALDLLFYTDLDEEVKNFAKEDLERDIISTSSTSNQVLAESVPGFDQISMWLPNFGLERITVSSRDIDKRGTVTDINLRRMRHISEIVNHEATASIDQNPTVDMTLTGDTTVLTLNGDISEEQLEQIKRQLRQGLRTRGEN